MTIAIYIPHSDFIPITRADYSRLSFLVPYHCVASIPRHPLTKEKQVWRYSYSMGKAPSPFRLNISLASFTS